MILRKHQFHEYYRCSFYCRRSLSLITRSQCVTFFFGVELATDRNQLSREHQQRTCSPQQETQQQAPPLSRLAQSGACVRQRPLLREIDVLVLKELDINTSLRISRENNLFRKLVYRMLCFKFWQRLLVANFYRNEWCHNLEVVCTIHHNWIKHITGGDIFTAALLKLRVYDTR
jgi:hypothetical protein